MNKGKDEPNPEFFIVGLHNVFFESKSVQNKTSNINPGFRSGKYYNPSLYQTYRHFIDQQFIHGYNDQVKISSSSVTKWLPYGMNFGGISCYSKDENTLIVMCKYFSS